MAFIRSLKETLRVGFGSGDGLARHVLGVRTVEVCLILGALERIQDVVAGTDIVLCVVTI